MASFNDFDDLVNKFKLTQQTVDKLKSDDLDNISVLKELTPDDIDGLSLSVGQKIALRKAVKSLNNSELALQQEENRLQRLHDKEMFELETQYNKDIMKMGKDAAVESANIRADLIKSSEISETNTNSKTGNSYFWGFFKEEGDTKSNNKTKKSLATVDPQTMDWLKDDFKDITSKALVDVKRRPRITEN